MGKLTSGRGSGVLGWCYVHKGPRVCFIDRKSEEQFGFSAKGDRMVGKHYMSATACLQKSGYPPHTS